MRPTDENQSSSRRPNLMSPARRSTGEINILAMLEGRAGGRRTRGRTALRWYGAGAVLACTLLAALAWLVCGAPVRDASPSVMAAATPAVQAAPTPPGPPTARTPATALDVGALPNAREAREADAMPEAKAARDVRGAHIVDLVPSARAAAAPARPAVASSGPGGNVAAVDVLAANVAAVGVPATSLPAVGVRPARPAAASRHRAPATVTAPAPRLAALVAPGRPQPVSRAIPHAAPSLARTDTPAGRHKRGPATVRAPSAPPATVDTDVAVISAILQHAGADAADAAPTVACSDKPCGPRMPSR